jgi:uncharacterized protein (DUF2249 family)
VSIISDTEPGGTMQPRTVDLRPVRTHRRRSEVLREFDRLRAGEALVLLTESHPLPLVHWLSTERFGAFRGAILAQGPVWQLEITRRETGRQLPPDPER